MQLCRQWLKKENDKEDPLNSGFYAFFLSIVYITRIPITSGDFQMHFNEGGSSEDEEIEEYRRMKKASAGPTKSKRSKECPGCGATVALSVRECGLCDYQFTSKSMSNTALSAAQESANIRDKFPFEPERVSFSSAVVPLMLILSSG